MSAPLSPERLAEIRAREQAATGGPWYVEWEGCDCDYACSHGSHPYEIRSDAKKVTRHEGTVFERGEHARIANLAEAEDVTDEDAAFIAHARQDIPALLDEVERLTAERDRLQAFAERVVRAPLQGCDVDGGDVQAWAVEAGVLVEVEATAPCGESCWCAGLSDFPQRCYRIASEVRP